MSRFIALDRDTAYCGSAGGVFSLRKIERAIYDSVAFRYVTANTHPDEVPLHRALKQRVSNASCPLSRL